MGMHGFEGQRGSMEGNLGMHKGGGRGGAGNQGEGALVMVGRSVGEGFQRSIEEETTSLTGGKQSYKVGPAAVAHCKRERIHCPRGGVGNVDCGVRGGMGQRREHGG